MLRDEEKEFKQRKFMGNISFCRNRKNFRWVKKVRDGGKRVISILAERGEGRQEGGRGGEMRDG